MASLANTIYNPKPGEQTHTIPDPAELLNEQVFPDGAQLSKYFIEAFISAAYRKTLEYQKGRYRQISARRWLAFLAHSLDSQQTTQISWWRLHRMTPIWLVPLTVGIVSGIIEVFSARVKPAFAA